MCLHFYRRACPPQEGDLQDMSVCWSLKGALVHNLVMALCLGPSMCKGWPLFERCENAAAGFVAVDVFRMLAKKRASEARLPTGSCFLASQTAFNVQGAALTVLAMSISKPAGCTPWVFGQSRISEISIEQHFGMLRSQSANSHLSMRSFLQASARRSLLLNDELNRKQKHIARPEPALTEAQFFVNLRYVSLYLFIFMYVFFRGSFLGQRLWFLDGFWMALTFQ